MSPSTITILDPSNSDCKQVILISQCHSFVLWPALASPTSPDLNLNLVTELLAVLSPMGKPAKIVYQPSHPVTPSRGPFMVPSSLSHFEYSVLHHSFN
ncbi:hypothetical protein CHUAL_009601 [Chamberlinius hualienensis]